MKSKALPLLIIAGALLALTGIAATFGADASTWLPHVLSSAPGALLLAAAPAVVEVKDLVPIIEEVKSTMTGRFDAIDSAQGETKSRLDEVELLMAKLRSASGGSGDAFGQKTLGDLFVEKFASERDGFLRHKAMSLTIDCKTINAVGASGVGLVTGRGTQTAPEGFGGTRLFGALRNNPSLAAAALVYPRRTGVSGAAAVQSGGEGGTKATAEPVFTQITTQAATVAGLCVLSEQALRTDAGLKRAIDSHLRKAVADAADAYLLAGTTEGSWDFAGYMGLATDFHPSGTQSLFEAIIGGITHMSARGYSPSHVVMRESDFLDMAIAKDADGRYLSSVTYPQSLPLQIGGVRVCLSDSMTGGHALLIDQEFVTYDWTGQVRIDLGYTTDQFAKNLITARAEIEIVGVFSDYEALLDLEHSS